MLQIEFDGPVSLALSAKNWAESKRAVPSASAQSSALCRRSGRSPALPYPPHKCLQCTTFFINPFQRGHFYFVK